MMNIEQSIAALKTRPDFAEKVGMVLVHRGTVRGVSRQTGAMVQRLEVRADQERIAQLCVEYKKKPGIYEVLAEARSGSFAPGEDLLLLLVAGDIRENVLATLAALLNRIKTEAIEKTEILRNDADVR